MGDGTSGKALVSVIMPCYNHEKYVGEAIDSVLNQTYENIELIVLDNGSTDNSYEIIKGYGSRIHKVLRLEQNDLILAGEMLRKNAEGDYIAYMTSDDCWLPDKIEKQMKVFAENPEVGACFTWIHAADEQLNLMPNSTKNVFCNNNRTRYEWLEKMLLKGNCLAYPSAVIKRECECVVFEKCFYQSGDMYLWMRILLEHDIYVVEEPLILIRWHPSNQNGNTSALNFDSSVRIINEEVLIVEDIIERMEDECFLRTFGKYMRNAEAGTHDQIMCEKLFLLMMLAEETPYLGGGAIAFFYKHFKYEGRDEFAWKMILKEQYNFSYMDFQKYCAKHGIGFYQLQINDELAARGNYQRRQMCLEALEEAAYLNIPVEERRKLYRNKIYGQLDDSNKRLVHIMQEYIGGILAFISEGTDEEIEEEVNGLIDSMHQSYFILEKLWNTFLCEDKDVDEMQWFQCMDVLKNGALDVEMFCEDFIPFIAKVYEVLKQYSD